MVGMSLRPDLILLLEKAGCSKIGDGKQHEVWASPNSPRPFTIPSTLKSHHTANEILRQAGIITKL